MNVHHRPGNLLAAGLLLFATFDSLELSAPVAALKAVSLVLLLFGALGSIYVLVAFRLEPHRPLQPLRALFGT